MTVTELAIKRPILVVVVFSFLGVLGVFGFLQLKYDLMPKMTAPMITITTVYPGGSPNEVETSITKLIEDAISGIDKVETISSISSEGRSFVKVEFNLSANVDFSLQDAQRKVNEISLNLPKDARAPIISKIAFDEIPVIRLAVKSNMPSKEFYQFVKDKIQPQLSKISGVGIITIAGGEEREIKVSIDLQKMRGAGLSLAQVAAAVKTANLDFPTGDIKQTEDQYVVRVAGKFQSVDELGDLVVTRTKQGGEIKLKDIANVEDGIKEIININRLNGVNSIGLTIQKQNDANTVDVSKLVRKQLDNLQTTYKDIDLQFNIAQDGSIFIMDSVKAVGEDLFLAILLVAFVMLIFLHSIRNSLIVMVAIPSSLISTFFIMYVVGFSLNLMTLLAMSLVIGILVDDSIVVLENIYRHLEMGDNKRSAALRGRNEIGFAALSITMVDVVVFIPLALITGMIGDFLRQYALVIVFSTLLSLLVSFTVTPMLASRFSKLEQMGKGSIMGIFGKFFERGFAWLTRQYTGIVKWSLNHVWLVAISTILIFLSSIFIAMQGFIGVEFMPNVDRGELILTVEMEPGVTIEQNNYISLEVEKALRTFPEIEKVLASVGSSSMGIIGTYSNNNTEFTITLVDKSKRKYDTDDMSERIKAKIKEIPGIKPRVAPVSILGTSNRPPISILVSGTDFSDVNKAAKQIMDVAKTVKGATDVRLSSEEGKPELRVEIDRKKMSALGLTISDVGQNLKIALTGDDDSKYNEGVTQYDIRIQLDQFDRSDPLDVGSFSFVNNKGQQIELRQFATIYQTTGPTKLEREDRISSITVYSQVFGATSGVVSQEIIKKVKTLDLPKGISYKLTGEQKTMAESMLNLIVALFAGILFVYMIMVALYNSFLYPFVVLFSIPVAMVGALFGLALTSKSISIYSMLGIIMLIGLVAKNAILLVDRTNQMRDEKGLSTFEALVEAGQTRLRPILMTTFSMIFGMLPIALSTAAGSEAKSSLAVVLIGGLASSLMLTLVLVPVVYQSMDKLKNKVKYLIKKYVRKDKQAVSS